MQFEGGCLLEILSVAIGGRASFVGGIGTLTAVLTTLVAVLFAILVIPHHRSFVRVEYTLENELYMVSRFAFERLIIGIFGCSTL